MRIDLKKILIVVILVFVAVLSFFPVAQKMSDPETYAASLSSIDREVRNVQRLTAASTLASAGISAIPDDTATPLAEKLADFTEYFLLILCVLYAEKYLLGIIGIAVFRILLPLACLFFIAGLFRNPTTFRPLAAKLAIFGLIIAITIPRSLRTSDAIYDTYQYSIDNTIHAAEQLTEDTSSLPQEDSGSSSLLSRLGDSISSLLDRAAAILNSFLETLAVMIVTSCIIPVLVLLFFVWLVKVLTGVKITVPARETHKNRRNAEDAV